MPAIAGVILARDLTGFDPSGWKEIFELLAPFGVTDGFHGIYKFQIN